MGRRVILVVWASVGWWALGPRAALGQYDPPAGYYNSATGTGLTLKNNLHDIIHNHVVRSYDAARYSLQLLDRDPNDPSRIILIYTGASVPGTWDAGATWDREHQWPRSLGVGTSGPDNSDEFQLRPCNPSVNGSRSNSPYGIGAGYWDPLAVALPGVNDRGDCSRAMFYMAVRYDGSDANTVDLELVNGYPGSNQMGDLARMLEWHYSDPVNDIERRRNHLVWSSQDNPQYYQGNRNPFIDRPEFVWAIWGTAPNNSKVYLGTTEPPDGTSTESVTFRVIKDSALPSQVVPLHKMGDHPTTYDVTVAGEATATEAGTGLAFVGGVQDRDIPVGIVSTATAGQYSGVVTVDNTDLTSAGTGQGSADGNDIISVAAEVLDHSEASFNAWSNEDVLIIDFGTVAAGSGVQIQIFSLFNLESTPEFTAALDFDSISGSGDTATLYTDLVVFSGLAAGSDRTFVASFDTQVAAGAYQAVYTLGVSDEDVPGAQSGTSLVLTLRGEVAASALFPFDANGDGHIDLFDYTRFEGCMTGPDGGLVVSPCDNHDFDTDGDVDLEDHAAFQRAFTG
jgi:endonuclease I